MATYWSNDDDQGWTFQDRTRKARKEHVCSVCGKPIAPGQKYRYYFGLSIDGLWQFKQHLTPCFDEGEYVDIS